VLIGSMTYPSEEKLASLRCPGNDVAGMKRALQTKGKFLNLIDILDKPSFEIAQVINRTLKEAGKNDLVVVYFSCHGKLNKAGKLHLATVDTNLHLLETTSISLETIKSCIDVSPCRKTILILDSCYSGAAGDTFLIKGDKGDVVNEQLNSLSQGRGLYILTASTAVEVAKEDEAGEYSVFTRHFIEGLEGTEADRDGDGIISIDELYEYVHDKVTREAHHEPMKWGLETRGRIDIAFTGQVPRQQRRDKLRQILLELQQKDIFPDPVVSDAMEIIATEPHKLSASRRALDSLLERLYKDTIRPSDFIHQWYTLRSNNAQQEEAGPSSHVNRRDHVPNVANSSYDPTYISSVGPVEEMQGEQEVTNAVPGLLGVPDEIPLSRPVQHEATSHVTVELRPKSKDARQELSIKKMLIIAVNPPATVRIRLDKEIREITKVLRRSRYHAFIVEVRWAVRMRDLRSSLLDFEPNIVHFCGHGTNKGIILTDDDGGIRPVSPDMLSGLLRLFANQVECVIFNACYSQEMAEAKSATTGRAGGMRKAP